MMRHTQSGSFTGTLRAVDLDTGRITLRHVAEGIPVLRGIVDAVEPSRLKNMLNTHVRIIGDYESAGDGVPRLIRVEDLQIVQSPLLEQE